MQMILQKKRVRIHFSSLTHRIGTMKTMQSIGKVKFTKIKMSIEQ